MHQYLEVKSSLCDSEVYLTPETDAAEGEKALSPLIKIQSALPFHSSNLLFN